MEESELVVAEENNFENWAIYKQVALLGKFGVSKHWCKVYKMTLLPSKNFYNYNVFDIEPDWRNEAWSFGEIEFEHQKKLKSKYFSL